jgi:hypothetical protein
MDDLLRSPMFSASVAMVPRARFEERLAIVRARIAELERATGTGDVVVIVDAPQLRELKDEEEFLEVLCS